MGRHVSVAVCAEGMQLDLSLLIKGAACHFERGLVLSNASST